MKPGIARTLVLAAAALSIGSSCPAHALDPASDTQPALVFKNGYPAPSTSASLYDELDYQRAVQAYIGAVPLVNAVALDKALTAAGVSPAEPSLLVFDRPLTPKQVFMTANSAVIYAFSVFD